jgi:hypothetical protein
MQRSLCPIVAPLTLVAACGGGLADRGGAGSSPVAGAATDPATPVPSADGAQKNVSAAEASGACRASESALDLAIGGTASASGADAAPVAAFDDNTGTKWVVDAKPSAWIAYAFAASVAHVVKTYTLASPNDGASESDPTSWEFQGSNDRSSGGPVNWTTLDTRRNQLSIGHATRTFSIDNAAAYHQYRLLITANGGSPYIQLAELQLFGNGTPVFSVDDGVTGGVMHHFNYSQRWEHTAGDVQTLPLKYGLSSTWTRVAGEYVTFAFRGSQIKLYGVKHPQHGIVAVSVDEGSETEIDLYGPIQTNVLIYTSPVLCVGLHQLKARVTGKKNEASSNVFVSIDRAQVIP